MSACNWYQIRKHLYFSCAALACASASFAVDLTAPLEGRIAIVTGLQITKPSDYQALRKAGSPETVEKLEMSGAEVWSVPRANWSRFVAEGKRLNITIAMPEPDAARLLTPMDPEVAMSPEQGAMMHDAMRSKAAMGMTMMHMENPEMQEFALTRGMKSDASIPSEVNVQLSDSLSVTGQRTSISKIKGGYAWHGVVAETGEPMTLLWWVTGRMTGTVTYKRKPYSIRNLGGGMLGIVKMDPGGFPEEHAPMSAEQKTNMKMLRDPLATEGDASALMQDGTSNARKPKANDSLIPSSLRNLQDAKPERRSNSVEPYARLNIVPPTTQHSTHPIIIRMVVAYTSAAAKHYADIETDLVPLAIEEANQSFRNSGIGNVELELAYAYRTPYVEDGTHFDHVFRFVRKNDGYMDEVHGIRSKHAADVAVLIVEDSNGCGLAAQVFAKPDRAFAVVNHECAATMYSLGHEIGHLIGARHDVALDNSSAPFTFGHGYVSGTSWRTMMSYKESCDGCIRLPLWSNPEAQVNGAAAGDETSNNARVIAENASRVAGFHNGPAK